MSSSNVPYSGPDYTGQMVGLVVGLLAAALVVYCLAKKSCVRVRHSEVMILERCGRFRAILKPGVHWLVPILDAPRKISWRYLDASSGFPQIYTVESDRVDMREHLIDLGNQTVITRDTVQLELDALVYFRVVDPLRAVYMVQDLPASVELLTQSTLRNIVAGLTLDDTFSSRELINGELLSKVQRDSERWGCLITRVEIFDILPPGDILDSMAKQITAERERRSNVLRADGERESSIIESRGQAAKVVLEAEAFRASAVLRAKGSAEAKKVMASAEAQCLGDIRSAVQPFSVKGTDYLTALEYTNSISRVSSSSAGGSGSSSSSGSGGAKVVLFPVDACDALSTVLNLAKGKGGNPGAMAGAAAKGR